MPFRTCLSVHALIVAGVVCSGSAGAQQSTSAVAIARPGAAPHMVERSWTAVKHNIDQASDRSAGMPAAIDFRFTTLRHDPQIPVPQRDPHDGNYARRGAIIGALATGVATAVIVGLFAKRDCEPGLCGTEFQRGALVGGGVGLAAGGVLGWLIGAEISRPQQALPPG